MDRELTSDRWLTGLLRLIGSSSLLALPFVLMPTSWLAAMHEALGLGRWPGGPVVSYLARSTSALYALLGGLFWLLSFDLPRYRNAIAYLGTALLLFGAILLVVDWRAGLPLPWVLWEGPFVALYGATLYLLNARARRSGSA